MGLVNFASNPVKMMEKILLEANTRHVKDKKVIESSYYGFMKETFCLTNLIAFHNEMSGLVDEGEAVDVVCPAFSQALSPVSL